MLISKIEIRLEEMNQKSFQIKNMRKEIGIEFNEDVILID